MSGNFFRWPVVLVADAETVTSFYEAVFGWQRWYDSTLDFDTRFHPVAIAAQRTEARLVVIGEGDPSLWQNNYEAPAIAVMEYTQDIGDARDAGRERLGRGDLVLMVRTNDVDSVYERAVENGARISSPPTDWVSERPKSWTVALPGGLGDTGFRTASFFDPAGTYVEVSVKRYAPSR